MYNPNYTYIKCMYCRQHLNWDQYSCHPKLRYALVSLLKTRTETDFLGQKAPLFCGSRKDRVAIAAPDAIVRAALTRKRRFQKNSTGVWLLRSFPGSIELFPFHEYDYIGRRVTRRIFTWWNSNTFYYAFVMYCSKHNDRKFRLKKSSSHTFGNHEWILLTRYIPI